MSNEKGTLYVVATPIGNLGDITYRAVEVLAKVDRIAAEDTRHSRRLLQHYGISTPCFSLHEYNERQLSTKLVNDLLNGVSIALISDAGTPLVSDPGFPLVREARDRGVKVVPIPGPSALITALSISGLPSDRFIFEGFLPSKSIARRQRLEILSSETRTLIFYESPHRIVECLSDMSQILGEQRPAVVARELTKTFESAVGDPLNRLCSWIEENVQQQKGEFVILVHGAEERTELETLDAETVRSLKILLEELPVKQAVALGAKITGAKKNRLYQLALELSKSSQE